MTRQTRLIIIVAALFATVLTAETFAMETEGYASWYGPHFQGRLTANGEIFDTNKFTAAHKSLPFGSIVKVTNLQNHRSVVVRINDRGPYYGGRIIDLSHAAAKVLGMLEPGTAKVKLDVLHKQQQNSLRTIQVATFTLHSSALDLQGHLEDLGLQPTLETGNQGAIRVVLPGIPLSDVPNVQRKLSQVGYPSTLVRLY